MRFRVLVIFFNCFLKELDAVPYLAMKEGRRATQKKVMRVQARGGFSLRSLDFRQFHRRGDCSNNTGGNLIFWGLGGAASTNGTTLAL
jgi:hypothetical protein